MTLKNGTAELMISYMHAFDAPIFTALLVAHDGYFDPRACI